MGFRQAHGVGDHKAQQYGELFIAQVARYCASKQLAVDVPIAQDVAKSAALEPFSTVSKSASKNAAAALFREGRSIDEVVQQTARAHSTVIEYLAEFLAQEGQLSPEPWVDGDSFATIAAAAKIVGSARLKPIFDHLNGRFSYDDIRISLACVRNIDE